LRGSESSYTARHDRANWSGIVCGPDPIRATAHLTSRGQRFGRHDAAAYADRGENDDPTGTPDGFSTAQRFVQVVEVPLGAHNVNFSSDHAELPPKYEQALQNVR
jgi:hypothetical protein